MAEGLGRCISTHVRDNNIQGLKISNSDIKLSHLQFVDDNMLMGKSSIQEAKAFNDIITTFGEASGMEINKIKSNIFFFNTLVYTQIRITRILGFQRSSLPSKFLGAPLIDSALKTLPRPICLTN